MRGFPLICIVLVASLWTHFLWSLTQKLSSGVILGRFHLRHFLMVSWNWTRYLRCRLVRVWYLSFSPTMYLLDLDDYEAPNPAPLTDKTYGWQHMIEARWGEAIWNPPLHAPFLNISASACKATRAAYGDFLGESNSKTAQERTCVGVAYSNTCCWYQHHIVFVTKYYSNCGSWFCVKI